jgi:hypothetical protein
MFKTPLRRAIVIIIGLGLLMLIGFITSLIVPKYSIADTSGVLLIFKLLLNGLYALIVIIVIPLLLVCIMIYIKDWILSGNRFNPLIRFCIVILSLIFLIGQGFFFLLFIFPLYPELINDNFTFSITNAILFDLALLLLEGFVIFIIYLLYKAIKWVIKG